MRKVTYVSFCMLTGGSEDGKIGKILYLQSTFVYNFFMYSPNKLTLIIYAVIRNMCYTIIQIVFQLLVFYYHAESLTYLLNHHLSCVYKYLNLLSQLSCRPRLKFLTVFIRLCLQATCHEKVIVCYFHRIDKVN